MVKVRVIVSIALITLLLALSGCSSGTNPPGPNTDGAAGGGGITVVDANQAGLFPVRMYPQAVAQTGGWPTQHRASSAAAQPGLAQPSELAMPQPPAKQAAYTAADLIKAGAAYDTALPNNRASAVAAPSVIFSPTWGSQAQPVLADAAYCVYRFNLTDYADSGRPQTLALAWHAGSAPTDFAGIWVGLANRTNDRWDWYAGPQDDVLTLASYAPYIAGDGAALIAIVVLGSADCALQSLKVGQPEQRATGGLPEELGVDLSPPPAGGESLPASVDLSPWCSPIGDQEHIGCCTCFATARGAFDYELGQVYATDGWDFSDTLNLSSPKYLYLQSGAGCGATSGRETGDVVAYLISDGDSSELNCPYQNICSPNWGQPAIDDAAMLNADGSTSINPTGDFGVAKLKNQLANLRKVTIIQTGLDWEFFDLGPDKVWNYTGGDIAGYHAMTLVGYDDARQAFKVRNSWGTGWAGGGYSWIGYQTFIDGDPELFLWAWTLNVDYDPAVAQRFCGHQQDLLVPANVQASDGVLKDMIRLTWQKGTGATGYKVYRDRQSNLVATLTDVDTWDDTGISDYLAHTYWLKATAPGLESALSSPDMGYLAQAPAVQSISPRSGEPGAVVTFIAHVSGSSPMTYAWDFGGGAIPNTSSNASPLVTLGSAGSYSASLTVTNDYGSAEYPFTLVVQSQLPPMAVLAADPLSGNAPLTVDFDASASYDPDNGSLPGVGIVKYEWDYTDDGTYDFDSGSDATVAHNYDAAGTYVCRMRVTDDDGASATGTGMITVDPSGLVIVILKDPQDAGPSVRSVAKLQADLEFLYGPDSVMTIDLGSTTLSANQLDGADAVIWPSDQPSRSGYEDSPLIGVPMQWTMGEANANFNEVKRAHLNPAKAGGMTFVLLGQYALINSQFDETMEISVMRQISAFGDTADVALYWYNGAPGDGFNNGNRFYAPYSATPNNLGTDGGFTEEGSWESDAIGWNCPGAFDLMGGINTLKAQADPANYGSGGYMASAINASYFGICFSRRTVGGANAGGSLVSCPVNYGDLLSTMPNNVTRSRVLENLLCAGDASSKFNSPAT